MRSRWLVVSEFSSILSVCMGWQPHRQFRYYRWRWCARLAVWSLNLPVVVAGYISSAQLLGRVTEHGPWLRVGCGRVRVI